MKNTALFLLPFLLLMSVYAVPVLAPEVSAQGNRNIVPAPGDSGCTDNDERTPCICKGTAAQEAAACQTAANQGNPLFGPSGILTRVINLLSVIIGIAAVIMIIISGFRFITSGSNPQEVTKARDTLLYAIIGVIIALLAQVLVRFILSRI